MWQGQAYGEGMGGSHRMKVGDLVQVLPARIGYYIIIRKTKMRSDWDGYSKYWDLAPVAGANFDRGGPMSQAFIEVASESR